MRLDDYGQDMELSTFILPLLESQVYDQVRKVVADREAAAPLKLPQLDPKPVLMLSLNLRHEAWVDIVKDMTRDFSRMSSLDPGIFDHLGPAVHLAIQDSDPIIAMGGADVMGPFGANGMMMQNEMFAIPIVISVLTRPSKLLVEVADPQKVVTLLRRTSVRHGGSGRREMFKASFQQIGGRDAWIVTYDIEGMIKLSFGVEVQGGYLIITNLPWSQKTNIVETATPPLNGAMLQADASAVSVQMPALFAAAAGQEHAAAMHGVSSLSPMLLSIAATPDEAAAAHARLLGCKPVHPDGGEWVWKDQQLSSSTFGDLSRPTVPGYKAGDRDFGLFREVERTSVNMQFEQSGLRTAIRWTLASTK